ncbi:MAG TPA: YceI family protein, partial [Candidatus Nitrosotalea sp.]|nr:YceI family protein [Candidatus Nitrosotalea sp.]
MTAQLQEQTTYSLDRAHTTVEFVVRHLMITKVRGRFTEFEGEVELAAGTDLPVAVRATIAAASIDTREDHRDAHLRS